MARKAIVTRVAAPVSTVAVIVVPLSVKVVIQHACSKTVTAHANARGMTGTAKMIVRPNMKPA